MLGDFLRTFLRMPPGAHKINADLAAIRQHVKPLVEQLIPWKEEKELELMSLNCTLTPSRKGPDKTQIGTIQSIYFEPMVAFAIKVYSQQVRDALLYCRTTHSEFIYRIKRHGIDIYFNGGHVAVLDDQHVLHGVRSGKVIGVVQPYSTDLLSIYTWGRDAGHMFNPDRPHSEQQRAFYILADLSEEEENIFLALGLFELLGRKFLNKTKK